MGFCPGGILSGGILSGGILSDGILSRWDFVRWDFVLVGFLSFGILSIIFDFIMNTESKIYYWYQNTSEKRHETDICVSRHFVSFHKYL